MLDSIAFRVLQRLLRQISWAIVLLNVGNYLLAEDALPKGSLIGRIVDPEGKPVAGAKIHVNTWGDKAEVLLAEAVSDSEGRFRLGPMKPIYRHKFPILIDAEGFAQQYIQPGSFSIYPGIDFDFGDIRVDRGRIFSGQVLSDDGKGLPEADVNCKPYIHSLGRTVFSIDINEHLKLDSEGRFRTPPMPVGELAIHAIAPGFEMGELKKLHRIQPGGSETLEPIRLEKEVPIQGIVRDEKGKPIEGVLFRSIPTWQTKSDSQGHFTVHGYGAKSNFPFGMRKDGYVNAAWIVELRDDGIYLAENNGEDNLKFHGPSKEIEVVMQHVAWIEGIAVDADSGEPVTLNRIVCCSFERKDNGEVVLSGCRLPKFEQPEPGKFRLQYMDPDEYHLALSADGYFDAEAFTPKVTELKNISGIEVKMKKKVEGAKPTLAQQRISGTITRDGRPVIAGWVALWLIRCKDTAFNGNVLRGRTVIGDRFFIRSTYIRDGKYSLEVPYQNDEWFVVVEEPDGEITQIGPVKIGLDEKKTLDIACPAGGSVSGRVTNVPLGWEEQWHSTRLRFAKTFASAATGSSASRNCRLASSA